MAKSGVSLSWGGFDRVIAKAANGFAETQELMAAVGETLVSSTTRRFETESAPDGKKWKKSKRAMRDHGTTLVDEGQLRKSVDWKASPKQVMVGSNKKYARIHQLGGKTGKGHKAAMPARPYLGVSRADMDEVKALLQDFLAGALKS